MRAKSRTMLRLFILLSAVSTAVTGCGPAEPVTPRIVLWYTESKLPAGHSTSVACKYGKQFIVVQVELDAGIIYTQEEQEEHDDINMVKRIGPKHQATLTCDSDSGETTFSAQLHSAGPRAGARRASDFRSVPIVVYLIGHSELPQAEKVEFAFVIPDSITCDRGFRFQ